MVIGTFPAAKLITLAIRQVSKPIATVIKDRAKEHPVFRKYVCMPPAQIYNWLEVKTKMWALNLGKPVNVPPLSEATAIELGANLLGEIIIFTIAATLLIVEYMRQVSNEAAKAEKLRIEREKYQNEIAELALRVERQDAQLRELTRSVVEQSNSIFSWHKAIIKEYEPFNPKVADETPKLEQTYNNLYNPDDGLLFRALSLLEKPLFSKHLPNESTSAAELKMEYQPQNVESIGDDIQPYVITLPKEELEILSKN